MAENDEEFEGLIQDRPELKEDLQTLYSDWLKSRKGAPASGASHSTHTARLEKLEQQRSGTLSRYEIRGELGSGGMGQVLEVWDTDLRRALAMKVQIQGSALARLSPSTADEATVRFLEEAQITAQLDHPGVVPVHELGVDSEGRVYFTMGRVKGRELKEIIREVHAGDGDWSLTRMVGALQKVCETMAFAHAKGVTHRDIKPANIMVGRFGVVYVMDWGLSRVEGREGSARDIRPRRESAMTLTDMRTDRKAAEESAEDQPLVTMDGAVIGTPAYMSPEQARGEIENVGALSDVYSFGAMFYEVLTGRMPYVAPGMRVSPHTLLALVISGSPEPVDSLAEVPAELVAICEKAMQREPSNRYAGMEEVAEDLRAYLENRVVLAYETGAWAETRKWVKRNRGLAVAVAATVLAVIGGLLLWVFQQQRHAQERFLAADVYRYSYFLTQADGLWPASPETVPDMEAWMLEVEDLLSREEVHAGRLEALIAEGGEGEDAVAQREALAGMVAGLDRLRSEDPEESVLADVKERHEFARTVHERSIEDQGEAWRQAIASIADEQVCPKYEGLQIEAQVGLVPIGRDANSGLWEFAHIQTGNLPVRDADRRLVVTEDTGLVFVLIPGGTFRMGAEPPPPFSPRKTGPNIDPDAHPYESPVHDVDLDAYFLSKYEMNQAQWRRATRDIPSLYNPDSPLGDRLEPGREWVHPVEQVSWADCDAMLTRLDLQMPTEAQWERAARAGESTVYAGGNEREALRGAANLADESARDGGVQWPDVDEWSGFVDGYASHAPVDVLRPNGYGLYHIHGNVYEWCRDSFSQYAPERSRVRAGDGFRESVDGSDEPLKIARGGSHRHGPLRARVSFRYYQQPRYVEYFIGLRPMRSVDR